MAVSPAAVPRSLTTRLAVGLLMSRKPVAVWKLETTISSRSTWTMSVSSQTLSTVIRSPRTTIPVTPPAVTVLPRTSGPRLPS